MTVTSVLKAAMNFNDMIIDSVKFITQDNVRKGEVFKYSRIDIHAHIYKNKSCRCPVCGSKCPGYDYKSARESSWRAPDINGVPVYIWYRPQRIQCKEHGVHTECIPWADEHSRFTKDLNNEIAFMALTCPKTVVCQYFGINWRTVGNSIKAAHARIEMDVTVRLRNLRKICVDETAVHKGHSYITVVYDMERNQVVWVHENHGLEVFEKFCMLLSKEECDSIEVVAGDGAKWIDTCTKKYFKNAARVLDSFHLVSWCTEALDKTRNSARHRAARELNDMKAEIERIEKEKNELKKDIQKQIDECDKQLRKHIKRGRPTKKRLELEAMRSELKKKLADLDKTDETVVVQISKEEYEEALEQLEKMPKNGRRSKKQIQLMAVVKLYEESQNNQQLSVSQVNQKILDDLENRLEEIKGTKYVLGMNPENIKEQMHDRLSILQVSYPEVYKAYELKEQIRAIISMKSVTVAQESLNEWITKAANSGLPHFEKLSEKIERHKENILNTIRLQANSSKSEATNTTIKALIKMGRGFKNMGNLFSLIYLRCSDLVIPLNNRYLPSAKKQKELREIANQRRKERLMRKKQMSA